MREQRAEDPQLLFHGQAKVRAAWHCTHTSQTWAWTPSIPPQSELLQSRGGTCTISAYRSGGADPQWPRGQLLVRVHTEVFQEVCFCRH